MGSFNFRSVIFHPNTEQNLIRLCNSLLEKKYSSFFPLFPLYAVLKNDSPSSLKQKPVEQIKKEFSNCKKCMIYAEYVFDGILFFSGQFDFTCSSANSAENKNPDFFLIPVAIQKKTDDKSLSSVFKTAQTAVNELNKNDINIQTFSEFSALQFKSFQIADCITDENQYRICNNFWIKIIS